MNANNLKNPLGSKVDSQYHSLSPILGLLETEAKHCLDQAISHTDIKIHTLSSRVKSLESLKKKLDRKGEAGAEDLSIENVTDLLGLRIVCLFLSDIEKIGEVIKTCFNILNVDNKITSTDSAIFGYQGVHFAAKIKDEYSGPRYNSIKNQVFEIQVRTITMDAWAAASHYLDYKNEKGVPSALRKDFFALSGLFYVADTHFEMFYNEAQKSKFQTEEKTQSTDELLSQEINIDTFRYYLKRRFPDRKESSIDSISELIDELIDTGYKSLAELDKDIERGLLAFEQYEKDHPPSIEEDEDYFPPSRFADVGVIRVTLELVNEKYLSIREEKIGSSDMWDLKAKYKHLVRPS